MSVNIGTTADRLTMVGRLLCAILFAALVSAGAWLAVIQEGHSGHILGATWTSHDFPDGLGHALGAVDNVPRRGMWGTFAIGIAVVLIYLALERVLPLRDWRKGLPFAVVIFLLWGLVFCPLVDARQFVTEDAKFGYAASGLFGTESSLATILSALAASLAAGLLIARIVQLVRSPRWWERQTDDEYSTLRAGDSLLELAEQRSDQRNKRPE